MASKLPPLPVGMPPGHSYWNDWYEKLRTLVNNSLSGIVTITGGTISGISPPIPVASGGTGASTLTANGILLGNGTSPISATAVGTTNTVLKGNTGAAPTFGAVDLSTDVTGTLSSTHLTGFSGTVALAKLTALGADGSLTVGNGLITAYTAPT